MDLNPSLTKSRIECSQLLKIFKSIGNIGQSQAEILHSKKHTLSLQLAPMNLHWYYNPSSAPNEIAMSRKSSSPNYNIKQKMNMNYEP